MELEMFKVYITSWHILFYQSKFEIQLEENVYTGKRDGSRCYSSVQTTF